MSEGNETTLVIQRLLDSCIYVELETVNWLDWNYEEARYEHSSEIEEIRCICEKGKMAPLYTHLLPLNVELLLIIVKDPSLK